MAIGVVLLSAFQKKIPKAMVFTASVVGAGMRADHRCVDVDARACVPRHSGNGRLHGLGLRPRLHDPARDRRRRPPRSHVQHALHPRPLLPVALVRTRTAARRCAQPLLTERVRRFGRDLELHRSLPGVRLALWLAGAIIVAAGLLAIRSLRSASATGRTATCDGTLHRPRGRRRLGQVDAGEAARRRDRRDRDVRARRHRARRRHPSGPARPRDGLPRRPGRSTPHGGGSRATCRGGHPSCARRGSARRVRPLLRIVGRVPGLRPRPVHGLDRDAERLGDRRVDARPDRPPRRARRRGGSPRVGQARPLRERRGRVPPAGRSRATEPSPPTRAG